MPGALDTHGMPSVMAGHVQALAEILEPGEEVRHIAMARLENPGIVELVKGLHDHKDLVKSGAKALNEALGGLLAVTDRRVIYLARTLVRRSSPGGNEVFSIPLGEIRTARAKRGIGVGDARKLLSLTVSGSKLWIQVDGGEAEFVEIKPLDAAAAMAGALA